MALDTLQNAETQDEKAEGYGAAAGSLAGTMAGAAAGAAIGSVVPIIGTAIGGLVGAYLGSLGGTALGGVAGKAAFGADDPPVPAAVTPLLMVSRPGPTIPSLASMGQSFAGDLPPKPGDVVRSLALPKASSAAAGPLLAAALKPSAPPKIEQKVDIQAPFSLVVQGDVQDAQQLFHKLKPLLDQHQREMAQQLESRKLYDTPHI
ncbi:hypothetical protein GHO35_26070 [Pseudomonas helleri]|uniref:hypothetical protein n=1 Tax=Pseudomonas helleri TaxID=1608996 RepID=UPI0012976CE0|nr:hypothetical protein [Pseudomonas helleri]MQU24571.1 hypothetical protein [Pseudomonas helleri]